jgi:hypothetical protein
VKLVHLIPITHLPTRLNNIPTKFNKNRSNVLITEKYLVVSELCLEKSSKCNNSKIRQDRVTVLCTTHLFNDIYLTTKFLVHIFIASELNPGQISKCKYEQRAITPKLGKAEIPLLGTAQLPNEIYLPTKFHVDISYSFRVMSYTKFKALK